MGSVWSGRRRRSKRRQVENCLALDTTDLCRWGLLSPEAAGAGSVEWACGQGRKADSVIDYELSAGDGAGTLRLLYRLALTGERFDYTVRLVTTRCHFGGVRWWLVCPLVVNDRACGRRVRKLYLSGRYFGCRSCHRLTYRSRQEHDRQVDAVRRGRITLPRPEGAPLKVLGLWLKFLTAEERRYADRPTARHVPAG